MKIIKRAAISEAKLDEKTLRQATDEANAAEMADAEVQQAARALDDPDVLDVQQTDKFDIENELDKLLKKNKKLNFAGIKDKWQNLLLVGGAGTGKTSRVKQWAKDNGIQVFEKLTSMMDNTDFGAVAPSKDGDETLKRYASTEFDAIVKQPSILFLDELNRGSDYVNNTLLAVIQEHKFPDPRVPGAMRWLGPNFLFTVAAINPVEDAGFTGVGELDKAMKNRFKKLDVEANPEQMRQYLVRQFFPGWYKNVQEALAKAQESGQSEATVEVGVEDGYGSMTMVPVSQSIEEMEETLKEIKGARKLAHTILSNPNFSFNGPADVRRSHNDQETTPRSLTNALVLCDGTAEDLLDIWNDFCNDADKEVIEDILAGYDDDWQNKSNDIWKERSAEPARTLKQSKSAKLRAFRDKQAD